MPYYKEKVIYKHFIGSGYKKYVTLRNHKEIYSWNNLLRNLRVN